MKADTFIDAIGNIDDRFLEIDNNERAVPKRKILRKVTAIAAAAALILCPLPVSTAFGVDAAYNILYHIAPGVAQTFKPVQRSCYDNGIEMTVISADRNGSEASVYLAMHDTEGIHAEDYWDLYDSYKINVHRDMVGHCSFSEYDPETHTAYFVVHLETMDGSDMPDRKVTFSVSDLLLGRTQTLVEFSDIDLSTIPYETESVSRTDIVGVSYYKTMPDPEDYKFLTISEEPLEIPAPDAALVNIGYLDGALHVLSRYDEVLASDSHGFIWLEDENGNKVAEEQTISFDYWDEAHCSKYDELIIPVPYEKLGEYTLNGEFESSPEHITGDWEVTFRLG